MPMTQYKVWWFPVTQVRVLILVERDGEGFGVITQLRVLSWPGSAWWWLDRARAKVKQAD